MIKGEERQIAVFRALRGQAQQKLHALGDLYGAFFHDAEADFRTGQILHDGDGLVQLIFHFADITDNLDEIGCCSVRKVEAENAHAFCGEFLELFLGVGSRTYRCNNFGFHGRFHQ